MSAEVQAFSQEEFDDLQAIVWPSVMSLEPDEIENVKRKWFETNGFSPAVEAPIGFEQRDNGPCGVLAAVEALTLKYYLFNDAGECIVSPEDVTQPDEAKMKDALVSALTASLVSSRADDDSPVKVVIGDNSEGPITEFTEPEAFSVHVVDASGAREVIESNIDAFTRAGGIVLFVYSLTVTRGVETVRADINDMQGISTLIQDVWGFCSMNLTQFVITGVAVDATDPMSRLIDDDSGPKVEIAQAPVGMVTFMEADSLVYGGMGYVVPEYLKVPSVPIWVVHGRDHYTTIFSLDPGVCDPSRADPFDLYHYNGLPPAGPRLATLSASFGYDDEGEASEQLKVAMVIRKIEDPETGADRYECALGKRNGEEATVPSGGAGGSGASSSGGGDGGSDGKSKCTNGCGFFGSDKYGGMCSQCYTENGGTQDTTAATQPGMCSGGCGFHGSPELGGFCSVCAKSNPDAVAQALEAAANAAAAATTPGADGGDDATSPGGGNGGAAAAAEVPVAEGDLEVDQVLEDGDTEPWRCRDCVLNQVYTPNEPGTSVCGNCGKHVSICRRTVWLGYDDLPKVARKEVEVRYMPPMVSALRTLWKGVRLQCADGKIPGI